MIKAEEEKKVGLRVGREGVFAKFYVGWIRGEIFDQKTSRRGK